MEFTNFPCPHCGGQIPNTMPEGLRIPCYHCGQQIVCPGGGVSTEQAHQLQEFMSEHGAAAAGASDQRYREQHTPGAAWFASTSRPIMARLPDGRALVIGGQVAEDGAWFLRAVDVQARQVVWETLQGHFDWEVAPAPTNTFCRGATLYLCLGGVLHAVDLETGHQRWQTPWFMVDTDPALAAQGDEMAAFELHAGGASVLIAASEEGVIAAVDAYTGQPLWNTHLGDFHRMQPIDGVGVVVSAAESHVILAALDGRCVASFGSGGEPSYDEPVVVGQTLYFEADDAGPDNDQQGVFAVDANTGATVGYRALEGTDFDPPPVLDSAGRLVTLADGEDRTTYAALDFSREPANPGFFARLFGSGDKGGLNTLPFVGHHGVDAVTVAGDLVYFDRRDDSGRRIVGVDARSTVCFDSGLMPEEPTSMPNANMQVRGDLVVYVCSPAGDDNHCELRALVRGQPAWTLPVGCWDSHFFCGDLLAVYGDDQQTMLVDPASGQVLAAYPFPD